jgi:UDP-2-acetamido-3-amino-2,3-dideoxy-glucuronate N-acetyltransferase
MSVVIAASADVSPSATLGDDTTVWHLAEVRDGARVGARCILGRGCYVDAGVVIGDDCKLQNLALVYHPAVIGDGVFIGPGACLTNDRNPRAVTPDGQLKTATDWDPVGVTCLDGASVGAGAVCVAPVTVGRWALVAAGAVVVQDVPDFALVAGNPARRIGWVGRAGARLTPGDTPGTWACPLTAAGYHEVGDLLVEDDT